MTKIRKMQTAAGGPLRATPQMTTENVKHVANKLGEYFLKGMGAVGRFLNAGFTSPTYGTIGQVSYARNTEDTKRLRLQYEASEQALAKGSTYIMPANYIVGKGNPVKGEEKISLEMEPWLLAVIRGAELYFGPKAIKGVKNVPRTAVNVAAKAGSKTAKKAVVAREIKLGIKLNTKNGRIEVTENYFNSPDKWYRITETPEKYGIMELGKNVTTHDASQTYGTINGWRSSMLKAPITKSSEGFIKRPYKIELNIRRKNGQAHGNTSQAAKGKLWGGTTSGSNLFPEGVIEGQAPSMINYGIDRTNFVITPWELVPNGGRVGFHTGEMPMSNLGWFQRTNKGTYTYEPIISEKRITYHPILLLEPLTSLKFFERPTLSNAQVLEGVTKWERNFKPKWHVANYPGYQLKGLMKGSLLEKQLSKNGTININLLNTYFNKASQIEREIANKVLAEKFAGLKTIDYNLFKNAILNELITYERVPLTKYAKYGMDRLGLTNKVEGLFEEGPLVLAGIPQNVPLQEPLPGIKINTFTFESPRIPSGNSKHYNSSTLGHSRTYTTSEEPRVLHVMESQSDWALAKNSPEAVKTFNNLQKKIADLEAKPKKTIADKIDLEDLKKLKEDLLNLNSSLIVDPQQLHLRNNYLQRQLQENLRYAAENGLTKMRYPTSETAAKIEGYLSKTGWFTSEGKELNPLTSALYNPETGNFEAPIGTIVKLVYAPEHQTILKKYADFPKLFLKLFKDQKVRTVTDAKGNTWYEVDVPKGYLSREWQFKQGGKMNIIDFLKKGSGIHIKKENRGKFTDYCGGKVTSECIAKGKASSNPAIRKRATFAANARKWKHEDGGIMKKGGKAFHTGVNVLDSNPKMSKNASRKVKKADDGTKLNTFLKIGNFLNSDTGKAIGSTLINGISAGFQAKQMNDAIKLYELASKSKLEKMMNGILADDSNYLEALLLMLLTKDENENISDTVVRAKAYDIAKLKALKKLNDYKDEINLNIVNMKQYANEQTINNFSGIFNLGMSGVMSLLNKKQTVDNGAPSNSYFDNYVNSYFKKFGTFNSDGSMNMLGGTFTIKDGYKPNRQQLFNYEVPKLNTPDLSFMK